MCSRDPAAVCEYVLLQVHVPHMVRDSSHENQIGMCT